MMKYQSMGLNQRPRGYAVKQTLQFALLLAIFIWLLHECNQSHHERKDYDESKQNDKQGANVLGRKGGADSEDVNFLGENEGREDGGVGDDELDRTSEEKASAELYLKGKESISIHVRGDIEPEREYKESQLDDDRDSDADELAKAPKNNRAVSDEDNSFTKPQPKIGAQHDEVVSAVIPVQKEMEDVVHSFHDENGIPQGLNDELTNVELSHVDRNAMKAAFSISIKESRSLSVEGEDVDSKEGSITAYFEHGSEGAMQGWKADI